MYIYFIVVTTWKQNNNTCHIWKCRLRNHTENNVFFMYLCGDCFALGEGCQRKYVECSDHIITSNLVNNKFELSIRSLWIKERFSQNLIKAQFLLYFMHTNALLILMTWGFMSTCGRYYVQNQHITWNQHSVTISKYFLKLHFFWENYDLEQKISK